MKPKLENYSRCRSASGGLGGYFKWRGTLWVCNFCRIRSLRFRPPLSSEVLEPAFLATEKERGPISISLAPANPQFGRLRST